MTERNYQLDGLRGLAALSVAVGHCATSVGGLAAYLLSVKDIQTASARDLAFRGVHIIFNADAAVAVFFVLSGYVLALSLSRQDMLAWRISFSYLIRRAFRLLPVSIVSAFIIGPLAGASWPVTLGAAFLIDYTLNGVLWSLQVEVVGSVVVLFAAVAAFIRPKAVYAFFLAACAATFFSHHYLVILLPCFPLGMAIRVLPQKLFNGAIALIGLSVLLAGDFFTGHGMPGHVAHMVGAFLVVGFVATHGPDWLLWSPIQFLGRVSYPFYLLHAAALLLVYQLLARFGVTLPPRSFASLICLAALSVPVALALGWIVHMLVEKPYIALGSEWARRLRYKASEHGQR